MLATSEYQKIQFAQISSIIQRNIQKAKWSKTPPSSDKILKCLKCTHSCSGETPGEK